MSLFFILSRTIGEYFNVTSVITLAHNGGHPYFKKKVPYKIYKRAAMQALHAMKSNKKQAAQRSERDHGGGAGGGSPPILGPLAGRLAGVDLVLLCVCMPHSPT